jgi:hypothetical protein
MSTSQLIRVVLILATVVMMPARVNAARDDLSLRVSPPFAHAPAFVTALVRVPRAAENRLLRVTIDSDQYRRSSDVILEGEAATENHTFLWKNLPGGDYVVVVELYGHRSMTRHTSQTVHVINRQ